MARVNMLSMISESYSISDVRTFPWRYVRLRCWHHQNEPIQQTGDHHIRTMSVQTAPLFEYYFTKHVTRRRIIALTGLECASCKPLLAWMHSKIFCILAEGSTRLRNIPSPNWSCKISQGEEYYANDRSTTAIRCNAIMLLASPLACQSHLRRWYLNTATLKQAVLLEYYSIQSQPP